MAQSVPVINQLLPYALALLLCDSVLTDPTTFKKSMLGVFSNLAAESFPVEVPQMTVYAALTNGHGKTPIEFKLTDDAEDQVLFEASVSLDFRDPRYIYEAVFTLVNVHFEKSGTYWLQLSSRGQSIIERRLVIYGPERNA